MKYAYLVAWREFSESIKAKGFWIGIFVFPVILFLSIKAPFWLEQKATPVRYFVLIDQSAMLGPIIEGNFEKAYQTRMFRALEEYARKNSISSSATTARTNSSLEGASFPRNTEDFIKIGGKDAFLKQLAPRLKPGAAPFQEPRRVYQSVPIPSDIHVESDLASVASELKPYLLGEKKIQLNGRQVDLASAILVPRDIADHVVRPAVKSTPAPSGAGAESLGDVSGEWRGTLQAGVAQLRLVFKIKNEPGGGLVASLDSLDQGAFDIPVTAASFKGNTLRLQIKSVSGDYEGTLEPSGVELKGRWTQGQSFPLDLQKSANPAPPSVTTDQSSGIAHPPSLIPET